MREQRGLTHRQGAAVGQHRGLVDDDDGIFRPFLRQAETHVQPGIATHFDAGEFIDDGVDGLRAFAGGQAQNARARPVEASSR